ncbi:MAG: gluconokinase [Cyclobacteriaceae bacterium]
MIFIVCGVAGSGKTTIGSHLADKLNLPFYDADDFHPENNIEKMKLGRPLTDADRVVWLRQLSIRVVKWENDGGAVLACSALKEFYRQILIPIETDKVKWIVLHGTKELIADRIKKRKGHFFDITLLDSQFEIFENPSYGWHYNIEYQADEIAEAIVKRYKGKN